MKTSKHDNSSYVATAPLLCAFAGKTPFYLNLISPFPLENFQNHSPIESLGTHSSCFIRKKKNKRIHTSDAYLSARHWRSCCSSSSSQPVPIHWNRTKFDYYHHSRSLMLNNIWTKCTCTGTRRDQLGVIGGKNSKHTPRRKLVRDRELHFHFPVVCLDKNYENSRMLHCTERTALYTIARARHDRRRTPPDTQQNLKNENWSKHVEGINFPPLFSAFQIHFGTIQNRSGSHGSDV